MSLLGYWKRGAEIIPFSVIACFFTCVGSTIANAAILGWPDPLNTLLYRLGIGYLGALTTAVVVLPLLKAVRR